MALSRFMRRNPSRPGKSRWDRRVTVTITDVPVALADDIAALLQEWGDSISKLTGIDDWPKWVMVQADLAAVVDQIKAQVEQANKVRQL